MAAQESRQASAGFVTPAEFAASLGVVGAGMTEDETVMAGPPREALEAGERIFDDWLLENSDLIREMGGSGNTHTLFAALWESWKKDL